MQAQEVWQIGSIAGGSSGTFSTEKPLDWSECVVAVLYVLKLLHALIDVFSHGIIVYKVWAYVTNSILRITRLCADQCA